MQRIAGTVVKTGALALALALAGCGGGGGGGDSAPAPVVAQRDVQGIAAKGLIKGAKVSIHAVDAQGVRATATLATAMTGADGTYKLQIPASVQNFVIEVSAAPGAVMADEATGSEIAIPDSMKLRSVVTLADNASGPYVGTVSPLTEMVAQTAQTADGKLPPQAVAQAKSSVRTLLGFDPETVKPVNSNSAAAANATEDEKNQSLALAAISKMASAATADCGQSSPGERISCVVRNFSSSVTVKDGKPSLHQTRLAEFRDAIQAVTQDKVINRTGKEQVVGVPVLTLPPAAAPEPTPVPAPTTPPAATAPTPLEATKTLFGSLRTNLNALNEGDAFRSTADAIKGDLDGMILPLSTDVAGMAALASSGIDLLRIVSDGHPYAAVIEVHNNRVSLQASEFPEQFTPAANGEGTCEIATSPLSLTCTVLQNNQLPITGEFDPDNYTVAHVARTFKLEPKAGSTTDFGYTASFEKVSAQYRRGIMISTPVKEAIGAPATGTITLDRPANTLIKLAVNGRMPGRLNAAGTLDSDYEDWSLEVTRTPVAPDVSLYNFGGTLTAMKAGQAAGKLEIDSTSFVRMAHPFGSRKVVASSANELRVTVRGFMADTTLSGTLRAWEGKQDKSKTTHTPTRLSFDGSLKHKDAAVFTGNVAIVRTGYENFDATLALSNTNFVADTVEIGGALSIPNRPKLSLTVGATRTGPETTNVTAQYRDGSSVINASVTAKAGEYNPLVKVSSAEGVAFEFTNTLAPVDVTKDGAVTASLNLATGIITYSDGSTESLK